MLFDPIITVGWNDEHPFKDPNCRVEMKKTGVILN